MNLRITILACSLIVVLSVISSCSKKGTQVPQSYIRFKVDGGLVECKQGVGFNDQITQTYGATVRGYHDKGYMEILVIPTFTDSIPTGSFDLGKAPFTFQFTYSEGTSLWPVGYWVTALPGTGTLNIDIGSRSHFKGTFSVVTELSQDGKPSKTITEGEFDVYR